MKFIHKTTFYERCVTVPTKAPVETETSTIINKRLFYEWISFFISLSFNLWVYSKKKAGDAI